MASLFDLFVSISGDNSGYKKAIKGSQADTQDFGKVAEAVTGKVGDAFASLGLKMTAAGIGAFFLKTGTDMQAASAQIAKTTGQTGEALAGLNASFRELYANSGRSAEEIAGGLAKLSVETKLTGTALESLTAANLRFAKVAQTDVSGAVEETQTVFKQFNIAASDQSDALDVLYATMTATGISASALASQMAAVGPTARAFGMSFVDTAALVGAFNEAGLNASDVTRGLNTLFAKFAEAGKDPKQALAELIERMRGASTETAALNELIEAGFAKRAAVAMVDAARRGALNIEELSKKLSESKGKVKEVADQTSTLTDELKKLGHEAALVGGSIGEPIIQAFTGILKSIRQANDAFATFEGKAIKWLSDKGTFSIIGPALGAINNALNPWAKGNYLNNWMNPGGPSAPGAPSAVSSALSTALGGGGAANGGVDLEAIKKAFASLGLKDLNKELADSIASFKMLAGAGLLTHDQMLKAAEAIQKIREQLKETRRVTYDASPGQIIGMDSLRGLPSGIHGGVTQDDLAALPTYAHGIDLINDSLAAMANELALNARNAEYVTDAFHYFGQQTPEELEQTARDAEDAYNTMREAGTASADAIGKAWAQMFKAQIAAQLASGKITRQEYDDLVRETDAAFGKVGAAAGRAARTIKQEMEQAVHRLFDDVSRSIADNLVEWRGWADSLKNIAKTVAKDVLNILIGSLLRPLEDRLAKVFGGVASGAGSAAGSAGGIAGGAGGATSAGATGVMGTIGAVGAAVGAVSSVIGNFQMAGMNRSLDVLVNHTLRIFNELTNFRADAWTREGHWYARTSDMWRTLLDIKDAVGSGGAGGSKGGITFNNCSFTGSPNDIASAIFTQAQLAGAI